MAKDQCRHPTNLEGADVGGRKSCVVLCAARRKQYIVGDIFVVVLKSKISITQCSQEEGIHYRGHLCGCVEK